LLVCHLSSVFCLLSCTAVHPPAPYLPARGGIQAGETITVKGNENIYVIAHEHNVSMRELIALNALKPPFTVRPGQTLTLPAGGSDFAGDMPAPSPAPLPPVDKIEVAPIMPSAVTAQSLAPIELAPPPATPAPAQTITNLNAAPVSEPVQDLNRPSAAQKPVGTTVTASAAQQPAASPVAPPIATAASDVSLSMIWPVQGPILSPFGAKGAGVANDGIDIGAPKGEPVVAAAPGTVVYAGNEMKGFGNLVLVRHQDDWVTAYAHLDRVMVKKDSIVAQGDMIGTVGKTGDATTPRLHFEVRHAEKPVDPAGVIKGKL
jgi:murein DD-endopeptidase MepM/ murein hydrolase activator NlpD